MSVLKNVVVAGIGVGIGYCLAKTKIGKAILQKGKEVTAKAIEKGAEVIAKAEEEARRKAEEKKEVK